MRVNGVALRALREAKGRRGAELARAVGISRSHLHNLETGKVPYAGDDLSRRIADELGVPVPAFCFGPYTDAGRNLLAAREARS